MGMKMVIICYILFVFYSLCIPFSNVLYITIISNKSLQNEYFIQVVSEYRKRGMEFILQAINHPTYLEDLTGLTELMKSASSFELDWDDGTDEDDDDCIEV